MIEKEQDFSCFQQHNMPIISILLNPNLRRDERFLCQKCLEFGKYNGDMQGLKKTIEIIEEVQKEKSNLAQGIINHPIKLIEMVYEQVLFLKSKVLEQFEEMINIIKYWINSLELSLKKNAEFSFYEELDNLLGSRENIQNFQKEVQEINQCYNYKVLARLKQFNQFQEYENCYQQLKSLEQDNQKSNSYIKNQELQILKQSKIKLNQSPQSLIKDNEMVQQESEMKLNLVDQSVRQNDECNAIAFNPSQTIMISNEEENIKVWSFNRGIINLITTLKGHSECIYCLQFSKKHDSFISGSSDNTIRCWKQTNFNHWISSQPYQHHTDWVMCIILNQNEDLLFSGSSDNTINVWMVDLNKNELYYRYSLIKHTAKVIALSLNQSENYLVSCAVDKNSIILWEKNQKNEFEFKHIVNQSVQAEGLKLMFIKDQQFIWITGGKEQDQLCVFELEEGIFKEKQQQTIDLDRNTDYNDEYFFPIIYNKQREIILIRHKAFIYIIKEAKNKMYQIVKKLQCDSYEIYGTLTDDGEYLVYWSKENKQYSTYELFII